MVAKEVNSGLMHPQKEPSTKIKLFECFLHFLVVILLYYVGMYPLLLSNNELANMPGFKYILIPSIALVTAIIMVFSKEEK